MRNNVIGKISMASSGKKRSRFNLSHDVNTTSSWSDTQPALCRLMIPDSKMAVQVESLVRLAPMVAPTFGRVRAKQWHQFVPISDLSKNFASLMAQEPVTRGVRTFTPTQVPSLRLDLLSLIVLIGARMTVYKRVSSTGSGSFEYVLFKNAGGSTDAWATTFRPYYRDGSDENVKRCFSGFSDTTFDFSLFVRGNGSDHTATSGLWLPLGTGLNDNMTDLVDSGIIVSGNFVSNNDYVPLDAADYVLSVVKDGTTWACAFRLSDFGKRLRKILLGCGYQVNFDSSYHVSLLPLFAYYKAYFDVFGLTLYNAWETTNCASILSECDFNNYWNFNSAFNIDGNTAFLGIQDVWWRFVNDLGSCWVTDAVDYVSAHITNTAVSPSATRLVGKFIDVDGIGAHINADMKTTEIPESELNRNGHAFIDNVLHGQLDSETLKRLYRWTNRNTIAGRRIYELLKAQGLGKFADECKSNFIGFKECEITISDVVSSSDTFTDASGESSGSVLGEYGGRGLQYDKTKTFVFEANEYGYWVTLLAVVPEAGYCQALDPSLMALTKFDFYNPDFDGLGYEATGKLHVVGACDVANGVTDAVNTLDDTFGFVPRYTGLKIANNVMNGDFNLRSVRDVYLPYSLDKVIDVNKLDVSVQSNGTGQEQTVYRVKASNAPVTIPVAGDTWRYVARYPWLGNFNRIFANLGKEFSLRSYSTDAAVANYELTNSEHDNFLIHNVLNVQYYAPMLPISDSFETDDDGKTNMSIEKA